MKLGIIFLTLIMLMGIVTATAPNMVVESDIQTQFLNGSIWTSAVPAWVHPYYAIITIPSTWIWRTENTTAAEAQFGSQVSFKRDFNIPQCANNIQGTIKITTNNEYSLDVNGVFVGTDNDWTTAETYTLTNLVNGANIFNISAKNDVLKIDGIPSNSGTPETNPAALIYRAEISYTGCTGGNGGGDPQVPEFGTIAALGIAIIGGLVIFISKR